MQDPEGDTINTSHLRMLNTDFEDLIRKVQNLSNRLEWWLIEQTEEWHDQVGYGFVSNIDKSIQDGNSVISWIFMGVEHERQS